jgi:hypothetical protein
MARLLVLRLQWSGDLRWPAVTRSSEVRVWWTRQAPSCSGSTAVTIGDSPQQIPASPLRLDYWDLVAAAGQQAVEADGGIGRGFARPGALQVPASVRR